MTISELIERLEFAKDLNGDIEVSIINGYFVESLNFNILPTELVVSEGRIGFPSLIHYRTHAVPETLEEGEKVSLAIHEE